MALAAGPCPGRPLIGLPAVIEVAAVVADSWCDVVVAGIDSWADDPREGRFLLSLEEVSVEGGPRMLMCALRA